MRVVVSALAALGVMLAAGAARADGTCPIQTWGVSTPPTSAVTPVAAAAPALLLDSPVARARDLLSRAKILDEQAANDDKTAIEIAAHLPTLRVTAKTARDKADRAAGDEKDALVATAEDLEADVVVSEAEVIARKRAAADNRQTAAALRARALHIVREGAADTVTNIESSCDPPYRFTADGRKIYRVECFR